MKGVIEIKDLITICISLITLIIPLMILFVNPPEKISPQTYVVFIGIILLILIGVYSIYIYSRWMQIIDDIKENSRAIKEMNKSLNLYELFNKMDVRLKVLEELIFKNKKGQIRIDPRIIFWILLIILLLLFLRTARFI